MKFNSHHAWMVDTGWDELQGLVRLCGPAPFRWTVCSLSFRLFALV
jgi:hypothetical protein